MAGIKIGDYIWNCFWESAFHEARKGLAGKALNVIGYNNTEWEWGTSNHSRNKHKKLSTWPKMTDHNCFCINWRAKKKARTGNRDVAWNKQWSPTKDAWVPLRGIMHCIWLVVWNIFYFPNIGNNHPNWPIFFRGVQTTNQVLFQTHGLT